jgi:hypothetical protein
LFAIEKNKTIRYNYGIVYGTKKTVGSNCDIPLLWMVKNHMLDPKMTMGYVLHAHRHKKNSFQRVYVYLNYIYDNTRDHPFTFVIYAYTS